MTNTLKKLNRLVIFAILNTNFRGLNHKAEDHYDSIASEVERVLSAEVQSVKVNRGSTQWYVNMEPGYNFTVNLAEIGDVVVSSVSGYEGHKNSPNRRETHSLGFEIGNLDYKFGANGETGVVLDAHLTRWSGILQVHNAMYASMSGTNLADVATAEEFFDRYFDHVSVSKGTSLTVRWAPMKMEEQMQGHYNALLQFYQSLKEQVPTEQLKLN